MVRDSPGGGGTHANSVQQRVAIGEATRQGEFLVLQQSRSNYQLPAGLAVAYARSSRRRVGVWQKACAALPTGSRALREFAVPSRDPRQRNSRPPGLARVCATGSGQVGTWQLENILQDRPVVNLHRAIQASFLFDRAAELRGGANVFRPTQKKIVVAYFDYTPERRSAR